MENLIDMVEYDPFIESMELIRNQLFRRGGSPPSDDLVKDCSKKSSLTKKINDLSGELKNQWMQNFKKSTNKKREEILQKAIQDMKFQSHKLILQKEQMRGQPIDEDEFQNTQQQNLQDVEVVQSQISIEQQKFSLKQNESKIEPQSSNLNPERSNVPFNDLISRQKILPQLNQEIQQESVANISMRSIDSNRIREYQNASSFDESYQTGFQNKDGYLLVASKLKPFDNYNQIPQSYKSRENTAEISNSKRSNCNIKNSRDYENSAKFSDKINIDQNSNNQMEDKQNMPGFPNNSIIRDSKNLPNQIISSSIKQQTAIIRKQSNNTSVIIVNDKKIQTYNESINQSNQQIQQNDGNLSVLGKNLGEKDSIISVRKAPQYLQGRQSLPNQDNSFQRVNQNLNEDPFLEEIHDQDDLDLFQEFPFDELRSLKGKRSTTEIRQKVLEFLELHRGNLFFYENSKPDKIDGFHLLQSNKVYLVATQSRDLPPGHTKIEYEQGIRQIKDQFSQVNFDAKRFFYSGA
ncbi:UNKNOWN [Stylonychia lemnae]|uniref:Uncharacterized protein n=1 Tax=Stylonychia lemnae TaxID=5949 RepID=A0A078AWF2_STYLE|nr:UNKNOWN [Stylonychia lemnae]|eukprot:CDW86795.1 UNKNOWN [Stylonychia lemnae]